MALASVMFAMALALATPLSAWAQADAVRYAEEPGRGLPLPAMPLAGDHDAFSVVHNPAGLRFVDRFQLGMGLGIADADLDDDDDADDDNDDDALSPAAVSGRGIGFYAARRFQLPLLPAIGLGAGLEFLRPNRDVAVPDPGEPTRLTLGWALALGPETGVGLSWHRSFAGPGLASDGLNTFDLGFSSRLGAYLALGAVVRDLNAPVAAGVPVQRRYELELVGRPLATDRAELAVGGRIGEIRADADAWLRWSFKLWPGTYLRGQAETRALVPVPDTAGMAVDDAAEREYVVHAGLEVSFGTASMGLYGGGARAGGRNHFAGSSLLVRLGGEHPPPMMGTPDHMRRIDIGGELDQRKLAAILLRMRAVRRDPAVRAIFLRIDRPDIGWAALQELRQSIKQARAVGKTVFAYFVHGGTRAYFLAAAADRVYVDPAGSLDFTGMSTTTVYFKGLLDQVGVQAEFNKIDEYKSAPEVYTRTSPSQPAEDMRNQVYDSLYRDLIDGIADDRGLTSAAVRALIDGGPYTAGDLVAPANGSANGSEHQADGAANSAVRGGNTGPAALIVSGGTVPASALVDAVATPEEIVLLTAQTLGRPLPVLAPERPRDERWQVPAIAVIVIEGDIVDGKGQRMPVVGRRVTGSETITRAIVRARADSRVRAIVLRINSPGGSALASELMAREVAATRGVKPIVCSLGDVAASGGYFAAATCDVIFAPSMAITGSIGIFSGKFDLSPLLARLGLSWHTYKRGQRADLDSSLRRYSDEERALVLAQLRYFYGRFIDTVASGRAMTAERVDELGRGRIWSGAQARGHRLVDEHGGLMDALEWAKAKAGFGDDDVMELVWLPEVAPNLLEQLLGRLGQPLSTDGVGALGPLMESPLWRALNVALPPSLWLQPDVPQARLPFAIIWE